MKAKPKKPAPKRRYVPPSPEAQRLLTLRHENPKAWRAEIRKALKAGGSVPKAAALVGVDRRVFLRWVNAEPSLTEGLELTGRGRPVSKDSKD